LFTPQLLQLAMQSSAEEMNLLYIGNYYLHRKISFTPQLLQLAMQSSAEEMNRMLQEDWKGFFVIFFFSFFVFSRRAPRK
jgi:hypothetical protein